MGGIFFAMAVVLFLVLYLFRFKNQGIADKPVSTTSLSILTALVPSLGAVVFHAVVFGNLLNSYNLSSFLQTSFFSHAEMVFLAISGFILLTGIGNILAFFIILGTVAKFIQTSPPPESTGLVCWLSSLFAIAILSDQLPWCKSNVTRNLGRTVRENIKAIISISGVISAVYACLESKRFSHWCDHNFGTFPPEWTIIIFSLITSLTWLALFCRFIPFLYSPFIILASLPFFAFITSWPTLYFIVPIVATITLLLASLKTEDS